MSRILINESKLLDFLSIDHRINKGSMDTEANELTVRPIGVSLSNGVTTVTPVG